MLRSQWFSVPIGHIPKMIHELFCPNGNYAKHIFFIRHPNEKQESVQCEQCFEAGNYAGAGCDTIGTHLDLAASILTEIESSPDALKELAENPELLNQLRTMAVESSCLINDAERVLYSQSDMDE